MYFKSLFVFVSILLTPSCAYHNIPIHPLKHEPIHFCMDCKYFLPDKDLDNAHNIEFGRCKLFYDLNVLSGARKYEFASICRSNQSMCGHKAKYYEMENEEFLDDDDDAN